LHAPDCHPHPNLPIMASTGFSDAHTPATMEKGQNVNCTAPPRLFFFILMMNADDEANSSDRSTEEFTWTEAEETAVRRKLDRVIVPLTTFLYLLCFLDRYDAV
jgi:hypothetical protein